MERLHKVLAQAGVASRRHAEEMITAGRVQVNGQVVTALGTRVDPAVDKILVDGQPVALEGKVYYLLNKPRGHISDRDETAAYKTALDLVPDGRRLFAAGRLDMNSEGLLLLTNDGELANRLTHPRFEHEKEYLALVFGAPDDKQMERLERGVQYEGEWLRADLAERAGRRQQFGEAGRDETWLRLILHEGKKRQIRHMCAAVGHPVKRLIRVRIGPLEMGSLKPGESRKLTPPEVELLRQPPRPRREERPQPGTRRDEKPQRYEGGARRDEKPRRYEGGARRDEKPRRYEGGARRDEKPRRYEGGARRDEKPRRYEGGARRDEKPRRYEGGARRDEKPRRYEGGARRDENPRRYEGGARRDEKPREYKGGARRDEKPRRDARGEQFRTPYRGKEGRGAPPRNAARAQSPAERGAGKPKWEPKGKPAGRPPKREGQARPYAGGAKREGGARPFKGGGAKRGNQPQGRGGYSKQGGKSNYTSRGGSQPKRTESKRPSNRPPRPPRG